MNALRTVLTRVNALLLMVLAGLAVGLTLTWDYYGNRRVPTGAGESYAAELLAFGLNNDALVVLQECVAAEPRSARSQRLRLAMAGLYMDRLGDYEKALASWYTFDRLIRARQAQPKIASSAAWTGSGGCMTSKDES